MCFVLILLVYSFIVLPSYASQATAPIEKNGVKLWVTQNEPDSHVVLHGNTEKETLEALVIYSDTQRWFTINVSNNEFHHELWLTDGTGEYSIFVMVNEYDNFYRYGPGTTVNVRSNINRFLYPSKDIESTHPDIVKLSVEITKDLETDKEKALAISNWISQNTRYDFVKYFKQKKKDYSSTYGALNTLKTGKGVCYDYSALFAALGRASGIQVKMVAGDSVSWLQKQFHAWNEVYLSEEGRWVNLDVTFNDVLKKEFFDSPDFEQTHVKRFEY